MYMKRVPLIFCLLLLQIDCVLLAQSVKEQVLVKTRLVPLGVKGQIRGVGIWKDQKFEELWIPSGYFPKPVDYTGPNPISLVSMTLNEEGKEVPVAVGHAQVPEGAVEVLLLMVPLPPEKVEEAGEKVGAENQIKAPIRYGIKMVDFSPAVFPDTSFMLWNLTGRPMLGTVGEEPFRAPPNQLVLIQPKLNGEAKALDAKILYADDSSRESYTSRKWFLSPGQKFMMIMIADPENPNRYLLKSVRY